MWLRFHTLADAKVQIRIQLDAGITLEGYSLTVLNDIDAPLQISKSDKGTVIQSQQRLVNGLISRHGREPGRQSENAERR